MFEFVIGDLFISYVLHLLSLFLVVNVRLLREVCHWLFCTPFVGLALSLVGFLIF